MNLHIIRNENNNWISYDSKGKTTESKSNTKSAANKKYQEWHRTIVQRKFRNKRQFLPLSSSNIWCEMGWYIKKNRRQLEVISM